MGYHLKDHSPGYQLKMLGQLILAVNRAGSLSQLLSGVLKVTLDLFGFEAGVIYFINRETSCAAIKCSQGLTDREIKHMDNVSIKKPPYRDVFVGGTPLLQHGEGANKSMRSEVMIPLMTGRGIIGAMRIMGSSSQHINHLDAALFISIGEILSTGIEKLQVEEDLQGTKENLENLFHALEDLVLVFEPGGQILSFNDFVSLRLGFSSRELLQARITDLYHAEDMYRVEAVIHDVLTGVRACYRAAMVTKYGVPIEVETRLNRARWSGREVIIGISRDIGEIRSHEQRIAEINAGYERLTTNAGEAIFRFDPEQGGVAYVNPAAVALSGYSREQWFHTDSILATIILPESYLLFEQVLDQIKAGQEVVKNVMLDWIDFAGAVKTLDHTFVMVRGGQEDAVYIECIARDVTEQKRAEEALRKSEERYALVLNGVKDGIWDWNMQNGEFYCSPRFINILGYKEYKELTEKWWEYVHHDDREHVLWAFERLRTGNSSYEEIEHRIRHRDSSYQWVLNRGRVVTNDEGNPLRMLGAITDITERKAMEEELRLSEARYRMVVEEQTELIYRFNPEGKITFVNEAVCRYFKKDKKDLLLTLITGMIYKQDQVIFTQDVNMVSKQKPILTLEHRVVMPDGTLRWHQWTIRAIFDLYGVIMEYQAVGRDINESKLMEESLKYLSMHDAMTGLYNRAYFDEAVKKINQSDKEGCAGIIVCDIDDLKQVNDCQGHSCGDALIKAAANILKNCFGESEVVARIGGDEFAILVHNASKEKLDALCEKVEIEIQLYNESNTAISLSMSAGYDIQQASRQDMESIYIGADQRMYQEKVARRLYDLGS